MIMNESYHRILSVIFVLLSFHPGWTQTVTNSIGMEFVRINPGKMVVGEFQPPYPEPADTVKGAVRPYTMWMGDGRSYSDAEFMLAKEMAVRDSRPGFEVTLKDAYYIATKEVTQAQWKKVMGKNPSVFQGATFENSDNLPVENITWSDAKKFIRALNKLEKTTCYRLPTEFEWEYAARAGATHDIPWKDIQASAQLGMKSTQPVGGKQPNAWGLYDMLGNVWEWVEDYDNGKLFADTKPPKKGVQHVLKGASFAGDVKNATYMTHAAGPGNGWDVGFRIVMVKK
jgi:formylglycine-generating enzyme required for sulfatase activity